MKTPPLRKGQPVTFRDDQGTAHPAVFIGKNPRFARIVSGDMEFVVAIENVERVGA